MEIVLFLWLAGVVDDFKNTFAIGGVIIFFILGMVTLAKGLEGEAQEMWKSIWTKSLVVFACAIIMLASLLPSKNTMYLMAGGYYGQKALQSETAGKVLTIINGHLDEKIKELTKGK